MPFKSTNDAGTVKGQMNSPVTQVSQPSAAVDLSEQLQSSSTEQVTQVKTTVVQNDEVKIESVPKEQVEFYQLNEDEILLDASIEAKPLAMNESYKIKVRDPGLYAYYWGEFKAKNGLRFAQLMAMGFSPASPSELIEHQAQVIDGKLILGDVMLMKMPKNRYMAHIKNNLLKSNAMLKPQSAMETAKARAGTLVTGSRGMPSLDRHKGEFFIPNSADVRDVPVNPQSAVEQKVYETI